jgi:hypothetical protein
MRRRGIRALAALAAAVATLLGLTPVPAHAAAVAVFTGNATFAPGIPDPTGGTVANTVHMTGNSIGVFGTTVGSCSFAFAGVGSFTAVTGSGTGTSTCVNNGSGISWTCANSFVAVGGYWVWTGTCTGAPMGPTTTSWACTNFPGGAYPITNTSINCTINWQ